METPLAHRTPKAAALPSPADLRRAVALHAMWLRGQPLGVRLDLTGRRLVDPNFSGLNLRGAIFDSATLIRPYFTATDLAGASFFNATIVQWAGNAWGLDQADFRGCRWSDIFGVTYTGEHLEHDPRPPRPTIPWDNLPERCDDSALALLRTATALADERNTSVSTTTVLVAALSPEVDSRVKGILLDERGHSYEQVRALYDLVAEGYEREKSLMSPRGMTIDLRRAINRADERSDGSLITADQLVEAALAVNHENGFPEVHKFLRILDAERGGTGLLEDLRALPERNASNERSR